MADLIDHDDDSPQAERETESRVYILENEQKTDNYKGRESIVKQKSGGRTGEELNDIVRAIKLVDNCILLILDHFFSVIIRILILG